MHYKEPLFYQVTFNHYRLSTIYQPGVLNNIQPAKFILFFNARSGSNLLQSLLNSHPDVFCDGEIFHEKEYTDHTLSPEKQLEQKQLKSNAAVYGFKLSAYQLRKIEALSESGEFLNKLIQNGWKVVYCSRSNAVKQALSLLLVIKTNIHHLHIGEQIEIPRVRIKTGEWLRTIYGIEYFRKIEQLKLKDVDHIKINYEKDLLPAQMHQPSANKVFHYLNVYPAAVSTNLIPTSQNGLLTKTLYRTFKPQLAFVNAVSSIASFFINLF